jgi:hypothetical protein
MKRTFAALILGVLAASPLRADTVLPGFRLDVLPSPAVGSAALTLPNGDWVLFDGQAITRWTANGTPVANLGSLPAFGFPSFIRLNPQGTAVVIGESSQHGLWTVPLDGSGPVPLTTIEFNFDAVFDLDGTLIVSADTSAGPANTNELVRVHPASGAQTSLGSVDGYSGPVALAANGDLYYATSEFPALASTDVLRWTAAQHHGGTPLSNANATVVATGFEGGFALAFEPDSGELYMAEVNFSLQIFRVLQVDTSPAQSIELVTATHPIAGLHFRELGGLATFDAYQPGTGVVLRYTTGDLFQGVWEHVTVSPRQPELVLSGPGVNGVGPVTLTLTHGVPGGTAFLVYCRQSLLSPTVQAWPFHGFLWHTRFDPSRTRRVNFFLPTDPEGTTELTLFNPGNLKGQWGYQFLVATPAGEFVGASVDVKF